MKQMYHLMSYSIKAKHHCNDRSIQELELNQSLTMCPHPNLNSNNNHCLDFYGNHFLVFLYSIITQMRIFWALLYNLSVEKTVTF